ncbi:MAG: S49 family peptidase [Arenicellales bacterium]|nr:S49 family peptidase [Arenicellales bacterium]
MTEPSTTESQKGIAPTTTENSLLREYLWENLKERKRSRRWNIFFKAFFAAYFLFLLFVLMDSEVPTTNGEHTALVDVEGVIAAGGDIEADDVVTGLRSAFEAEDVKGVIVRINSPGGSPVQAGYINSEMRRLREKYPDIPLHAVVSDICASGGYYVAAAADKIFVNKASIVGSIGVLMEGFGFVDAMKKLGIERRLITAGKHKGILDPFSPLDSAGKNHATSILNQVHTQFIDIVKQGRGDRLSDDPDLFSGLFWTGEEAKKLGLVDEFGSTGYVAREIIGAEKIVDYTHEESLLDRFAKQVGIGLAKTLQLNTSFSLPGLR